LGSGLGLGGSARKVRGAAGVNFGCGPTRGVGVNCGLGMTFGAVTVGVGLGVSFSNGVAFGRGGSVCGSVRVGEGVGLGSSPGSGVCGRVRVGEGLGANVGRIGLGPGDKVGLTIGGASVGIGFGAGMQA
jgi:hypothetical protein